MIEAFIICWNESDTIRLTIKHYAQFCDKITFYDNWSDDGTRDMIRKSGHEIITFGKVGQLSDYEYLKIKNGCWKDSKADWVIVCDCDEIIWHKRLKEVLTEEKAKGNTIFNTRGFDIYSKEMPKDSFFEIQTGLYSENYSKLAVFAPIIDRINYVYGCHVANPKGNIKWSDERLNLFHYRNIGGVNRLIERHRVYRERLSELNKKLGLGIHYTYEDERRKREWNEGFNKARLFDPDGVF